MVISYRYSRWDGSSEPFQIAPEELLDALEQDLLTYGDLQTAMRRMMERGMTTRQGQRMAGLKDLLKRLKQKRDQQLGQYNLDSMFDELKDKLDSIVQKEREGLEKRMDDASKEAPADVEDGDSLKKLLEDMVSKKQQFLDDLPDSFGGTVKALSDYDFVDDEARQEFQELLDMLRQRMLEPYVKDMEERLKQMTPEQLDAMKDMLQALNEMMEQQRMGLDPDYQGFMQRYGQFFPGAPDNLEDFIEQLQRQIGQMQSLMDSLSPEMQQSLQDLLESQILDNELRDLLGEMAMNLESLFPSEEFRDLYPFQGEEQVSWEEAMKLMEQLQDVESLEKQLEQAMRSRALEGIDTEKIQQVLGDEARQEIEALENLVKELEEAGYIRHRGNRLELTPKGLRRIGQKALRDIFQNLKKDRQGAHDIRNRGLAVEDIDETKTYEYGDPFSIHMQKTLLNAVERGGAGVPVKLLPEDLEIYRPEHVTRSATVLLLDQSRSMDISGAWFGAKKVALALQSLITTQFPRDDFYIIGFAAYAQELKAEMLPEVDCAGDYPGTNMHHALMLARKLLAKRKCDNKQIIMVTDGEPTAHLEDNQAFFWYPPSMETVQATLREVKRVTRDAITLNIFMLDTSYYLMDFVNQVTKINKGRAFYTTPERLGEYILVDYISNKRKRVQP